MFLSLALVVARSLGSVASSLVVPLLKKLLNSPPAEIILELTNSSKTFMAVVTISLD